MKTSRRTATIRTCVAVRVDGADPCKGRVRLSSIVVRGRCARSGDWSGRVLPTVLSTRRQPTSFVLTPVTSVVYGSAMACTWRLGRRGPLYRVVSRVACLSAICVLFALSRADGKAFACSHSAHCYAFAYWSHSGLYGGQVDIHPQCMTGGTSAHDFLNNEMWVHWSTTPVTWIETGLGDAYGVSPKPRFFEARKYLDASQPTGANYQEVDDPNSAHQPQIGDTFNFSVTKLPGVNDSTWSVKAQSTTDSSLVWSPPNYGDMAGTADILETGLEASFNGSQNAASSSDLYWKDAPSWHADWLPSPSLHADSGTSAAWNTVGSHVHYGTGSC